MNVRMHKGVMGMRLVGLDIGDKRIGIAVSDGLGITAQGVSTFYRGKPQDDITRLADTIRGLAAEKMVVGLPRNMNGTYGPQAEKVQQFMDELTAQLPLEVIYVDERLSSVAAERSLLEGNISRKKRKTVIDKIAATMILQGYLDRVYLRSPE